MVVEQAVSLARTIKLPHPSALSVPRGKILYASGILGSVQPDATKANHQSDILSLRSLLCRLLACSPRHGRDHLALNSNPSNNALTATHLSY
jgi:hypothetical protein